MFRNRQRFGMSALALLLVAGIATAEPAVLDKTTTGTPTLQSIEVMRFGPGGVLFLGDGRGAQVIAVETGGTAAQAGFTEPIKGINEKLAQAVGAPAADVEIVDLVVHPVTNVAFVSVRKKSDPKPIILTVDGSGKVGVFSLENVKYAKLNLSSGATAAVTRVTDIVWMDDRLLVAGSASEEFASKLFSIMGPLSHQAKANVYSTETYHVQHGKWETRAPMSSLMTFVEENKKYVAGAFACTPVVKYPIDELKPGEKVKGISMLELGGGNRPINMFSYEKDGKGYVLMNNFRRRAIGPSPYWTARFDRDVLTGSQNVNEKALRRLGTPPTDKVKVVDEYAGVIHMDRLGTDRALTIRENKGELTLAALPLP